MNQVNADSATGAPGTVGTKIFGIGWHKTGTSSLGLALEKLGYLVCHGAGPVRRRLGNDEMLECLRSGDLEPVFQLAAGFEAFQDNPWFALYRELDRRFPGSRFVLTIRSETRWLRSAVNFFGRSETQLRRWLYGVGTPIGNERVFLERYRRHNQEVLDYFGARPADLIVLDLEAGGGWRELCRLLGRSSPAGPFPHTNRSAYRRGSRGRVKDLRTWWRSRP